MGEAMAMEDMVDMVDTVLDMAVDTMASVRLRLSPKPRLRLIPTTMEDMAMEDMEDMVDMVLDIAVDTMEDMAVDTMVDMAVDTMAIDMDVNISYQDWHLDSFCPKLSQNSLFRINMI